MNNWFERIVEKVTPSTNKPIIVIDSQKYFEISELQNRLEKEGYSLVFVEPCIEVRMKYELEITRKAKTILVILGKYDLVDDMKESAVVVELCSKEIFRNFDEKAIAGLSYTELSMLDKIKVFRNLSFEETKKLVEEKIKKPSEKVEIEILKENIAELYQINFDIFNEQNWFNVIKKIGEIGSKIFKYDNGDLTENFFCIVEKLNIQFQDFLEAKYEGLFSKSGIKYPVTIDKVQDYIAANAKNSKIAFIVIDGMNYWQWKMLAHSLKQEGLTVDEKPSLSWLPSITAWARQAIFKGAKPDISIDNRNEGDLFKKYWIEKRNKQFYQIVYQKIGPKDKIKIPSSAVEVAGYVINALDEMMHGTILGNKQLFQSTLLWIKQSEIVKSVKELRSAGFDVYISTDHGNIDASLTLKLTAGQKSVMNSRSKRFVQFDTEEQAENFIKINSSFLLGRRDKNVYFKDLNGFGLSGYSEITHGGSHIMELLIPVGVIK